MSNSALTFRGSDGRSLPAVQPEANSVSGSPFTVSGTASETPELEGVGIMLHATTAIHVRFSRDGSSADTNDMLVPAGVLVSFPVSSGDILSMIANDADATVYVELVRSS